MSPVREPQGNHEVIAFCFQRCANCREQIEGQAGHYVWWLYYHARCCPQCREENHEDGSQK